jgi:hypothetical protein
MRYSVRRLRRRLPKATVILGCWMQRREPAVLEQLRDAAKADLVAASLGEAVRLCIEVTGVTKTVASKSKGLPQGLPPNISTRMSALRERHVPKERRSEL